MGRTDSAITRRKILAAAEALFSAKGYDGTGIEEISVQSQTNKALIYYHFKNKEGLLLALYGQILEEVKVLVERSFDMAEGKNRKEMEEALRSILRFLRAKRNVLKILMMESLKGGKSEEVFMELARTLMQGELEEIKSRGNSDAQEGRFLVYEFYTGFMPMYNYAVYGAPWASHFAMKDTEVEDYFIDSFIVTHLSHHQFA